ncbi:hypothetical protein AC1031_004487 [Aphanomyces cochlioides]|nr:hypothetical protein AC1031_004487 [Aphanomyces cochlioides]
MEGKSSAMWTPDMEVRLIESYTRQTASTKHVASGGDLRSHGISSIGQLQSKWRRLKADWIDYGYLIGLSGYGDGFSDDKWAEHDAPRSKINKLSRFRDKPFAHWDAISAVIGDSMANGEYITPLSETISVCEHSTDTLAQSESINETNDLSFGDLTAAAKRARILHQLKANIKRKVMKEDVDN